MSKFKCLTQYSPIFNQITNSANQKGKNFCPFFSLITAASLFSEGSRGRESFGKQAHELNLARAINSHVNYEVGEQMFFEDLVGGYTWLNKKDITPTSVELIRQNIIGYDVIFPQDLKGDYAVLFLKNGKFFVVMHRGSDALFYVRDCHESVQVNGLDRAQIIKHLNEVYQFDHEIDLDGYKVPEYSNIEFLHIMGPFKVSVDFNADSDLVRRFMIVGKADDENVCEDCEDYEYNEDNVCGEQWGLGVLQLPNHMMESSKAVDMNVAVGDEKNYVSFGDNDFDPQFDSS